VNLPAGIVGHDPIHKVQELPAAPTPIVARSHLAGHNIQRRKQSGRAMAFVAMAEAVHGRAVGKANKSLRALPCLNMRLFVNTQNQGVLGRVE